MILRRETIVALRARHTAFRIAVDLLYPTQQSPQPPPLPAPAWVESEFRAVLDADEVEAIKRRVGEATERRYRRQLIVLISVALFACTLFACVVAQNQGQQGQWPSAESSSSPPATQPATTTAPAVPLPMQRP